MSRSDMQRCIEECQKCHDLCLQAMAHGLTSTTAAMLFIAYSALTGLTLSFVLLAYTGESIATTFLVSGGTFAGLAIYGTTTRRSLSGLGQFLFMGLIGVVLASIVGIFWHSDALQFALSFVGVIVFAGLTAYDAQRLAVMAREAPSDNVSSYAIVGALALYLDFMNLFLFLLRLTGTGGHEHERRREIGMPMGSTSSATTPSQSTSLWQTVWQSFMSALGSIVFGMEDGTVSIFGLVFGVAASATNSQTVLLAGATGAISAAVSMMAGTYLDVSTERDRAQAAIAKEQDKIEHQPEAEAQEVRDRLLQAGFSQADAETVTTIIQRTPGAMLKHETAFDLHIGDSAGQNPWVQSIWMFAADLFAAFVPVLPFAFLPLGSARTVSLVVTAVLLLVLGVGRGIIGNKSMVVTALQTLAIAAAAGAAGLLVGSMISKRVSG